MRLLIFGSKGQLGMCLYCAFDNRPFWYRAIWRTLDLMSSFISPLPSKVIMPLCGLIAVISILVFGTRLEQRFSKAQIRRMLVDHGFLSIKFSETITYRFVIGYKA